MTSKFRFSARSEQNMRMINPRLKAVCERALQLTEVDFTVIEGMRTLERQRELYAQKKTKTMESKHLSGNAVDVMPVGADWNNWRDWLPVLNAFKAAGDELGVHLRFGVTWTGNPNDKPAAFLDAPHIELY